MKASQKKLEKRIREAMIYIIKVAPFPNVNKAIPELCVIATKASDQETHSKWFLQELEREVDKIESRYGVRV